VLTGRFVFQVCKQMLSERPSCHVAAPAPPLRPPSVRLLQPCFTKLLHVTAPQYLGWGVAATATPLVMLLAGGTFFWTSVLARVGGAAANLAAAGATAGAVTQASVLGTELALL
jgi:hypothetical protein